MRGPFRELSRDEQVDVLAYQTIINETPAQKAAREAEEKAAKRARLREAIERERRR